MKARISGMWRSLVAVLMALVLVVGLVPTTAFATEEHSVEDIKAALEEMAKLVGENTAATYAEAYQYALENGYIAYADAALDAAIEALQTLDLSELDPELVDEAAALAQESVDSLVAAKALLAEADVLDFATLESFLALVEEGVDAYEALLALLEAAGVFEAIEAAYNELLAALPVIEAQLIEAIEAVVNAVVAKVMEKVEAVRAAIAEAKAELEAKIAELEAQLEAAVEEVKAEIEAKIAELKAAVEQLKEAVLALNEMVENLIAEGKAAVEEAIAALEELAAALPGKIAEAIAEVEALLVELYLNATHGEYTIDADSHYVALGDGTAVAESYVELLAAEMAGIYGGNYSFTNLSQEGLMIQDTYAVLAENAEEIAKADLITLGFGNNGFTSFVLDELVAVINEEASAIDWTLYVGEEGLPYVEQLKAALYEEVLASTGDAESAAMLTLAAEAYAYSYVAYTCNLPEVVNAIHSINAEAQVIVVGMYNPLDNVTLIMDDAGTELAIGEYVQYMVDASNVSALAFAMVTNDAIYVDAPAVETANPKTVLTLAQLLSEVMFYNCASLNPSENGHAYITEQILNALTINVAGLLGDADGNGEISTLDALLVLQFYTGAITENDLILAVCDVDGDGDITTLDSMLILQYYTGAISKFPVE